MDETQKVSTHHVPVVFVSPQGVVSRSYLAVQEVAFEEACPEDPDGQHFIGCGCEDKENP